MPRLKNFCLAAILAPVFLHAETTPNASIRQSIAQAVTSSAADQDLILNQIAVSAITSKAERDLLTSWSNGEIYLYTDPGGQIVPIVLEQQDTTDKTRAFRVDTGQLLQDSNGVPVMIDPTDATSSDVNAILRKKIQRTLDLLNLSDPSPEVRGAMAFKLGASQKAENLPLLEARLKLEADSGVRKTLLEAKALIDLGDSAHSERQVEAADSLAKLNCIGALDALSGLSESKSASAEVRQAATKAAQSIRSYLAIVNFFGTIFHGFSLSSILLISALGLAITFGLMGVINMAHGEMIAVGAYTTYVVENVFRDGLALSPMGVSIALPGLHLTGWAFQTYFIFAIPLSFLVAALAGLALERLVIRFLYRRVLESLLATWGVSLIMQQLFRLVFGANNVQVNSPSWLLGNFTISDVVLGYNRIFVIAFAILIVVGTWLLLTRTPLGLFIRAVIQDRDMAACMGVPTQRVNMLTFAFGSGLAGLAGAFLSQIGNVGPSLGQSYIIDSFMTVVVGGVGSIAGTVLSAFGIGCSDQVLQQVLGSPVLGKIMVLVAIILFLQWKPGGFFPTRSRSLD
ncbi:MAG TPA: urea ABC transporter permease subunit UrtB [Chthoniobacterales bacterium]|nr:urea ABC transporter permease subunit UrtB [Chthoniobacterales bacterium]